MDTESSMKTEFKQQKTLAATVILLAGLASAILATLNLVGVLDAIWPTGLALLIALCANLAYKRICNREKSAH